MYQLHFSLWHSAPNVPITFETKMSRHLLFEEQLEQGSNQKVSGLQSPIFSFFLQYDSSSDVVFSSASQLKFPDSGSTNKVWFSSFLDKCRLLHNSLDMSTTPTVLMHDNGVLRRNTLKIVYIMYSCLKKTSLPWAVVNNYEQP